MHVLIVEDDNVIAENIRQGFRESHIESTIVDSAEKARELVEISSYDLVVLDWMLPGMTGKTLCTKLRKSGILTPILLLTAKSQLDDKIEGLNEGADDYLTKPFAMRELIARAKALFRRHEKGTASPIIQIGNLFIDTNTTQVRRGKNMIALAPKEYTLLEYLARNAGIVIDRLSLLHHVWGENVDEFSNTIDVHIRYLRRKIDDPYRKKLIHTVKNKGYMVSSV